MTCRPPRQPPPLPVSLRHACARRVVPQPACVRRARQVPPATARAPNPALSLVCSRARARPPLVRSAHARSLFCPWRNCKWRSALFGCRKCTKTIHDCVVAVWVFVHDTCCLRVIYSPSYQSLSLYLLFICYCKIILP